MRVKDVKRPLKLGEEYTVTCIVKRDENNEIISFSPVIDLPHSDNENGQPEQHYHTDFRFVLIEELENGKGYNIIDERKGFKVDINRFQVGVDGEIEYHVLPVVNEYHHGCTLRFFIRNSKLKHKCIQNGKCPHRGYDLSQEKPVDGIIRCPLHGLEFNAESGEITKGIIDDLKDYRNLEISSKKIANEVLTKVNNVNGRIITEKQYFDLQKDNTIFSTFQNKIGEYLECEFEQTFTCDYPPKPLINQPKIKFKVKL